MVSPIFFIFLLLSVRLISCDALCHVVLEVLVEERVVVFMEAGRSEIVGHIGYGSRGVCHNHATGEIYLGTKVPDPFVSLFRQTCVRTSTVSGNDCVCSTP